MSRTTKRNAKKLSQFYSKLAKNDNGIRYKSPDGWIPTNDERFYPGILCDLDDYLVNPKVPDIPCDSCKHDSRLPKPIKPNTCLQCDDYFSAWVER